jgi:hypothetical protein
VLEFDAELAHMVRTNAPVEELRKAVRRRGMPLITDHALSKVRQHIVDPQEIYRRVLIDESRHTDVSAAPAYNSALDDAATDVLSAAM